MVGWHATIRRLRVTARARRVGVVVGLATACGVAVGVTGGPEAGITAASAMASASAAIISLWRGEAARRSPDD
jgi:hypothetical protein